MAALTTIADEMATIIRAAVTGHGIDIEVSGRPVLNPTPPAIDIWPGDPSKGNEAAGFGDMAGEDMWTVRLRLAVNDYEANQDLLFNFMDQESDLCVPIALLDEPTLNGYATSLDVRSFSGVVQFVDVNGITTHIGCQWGFLVIPARS
jgi:hypothetical protein